MVERNLAKVEVAGSIPVLRSIIGPTGPNTPCGCSSVAECQPSKLFVEGSIPFARSILTWRADRGPSDLSPSFSSPAGPVPSRRDMKGRVRKHPGRSGCRLQFMQE